MRDYVYNLNLGGTTLINVPVLLSALGFFIFYFLEVNMSFSITLPDGSKRDFDSSITVGKLASSIATSLGKAAVAGKVNGQLRPLDYVLDNDAEVAILTDKDEEALDVLRASAAFVFEAVAKNFTLTFTLVNMLLMKVAFS